MEITSELNIDVEALIAFKIDDKWLTFRSIDKPSDEGLPGTVVSKRQNGRSGKKEIKIEPCDLSATEFKVYIYTKKVPELNGVEGIKVHPGKYRKLSDLNGKCRELHHVEVNKLRNNRLDGYKYRVVIHYHLYDDRPHCPDIQEIHKDPTIIHPDDPGGNG
ncbi:hypothetical protein [Rhodohalobacter sulfatireducens]|uniref:Uncharacterized protein n=1 Tax=Rhodohalobacter sulfatireducens TaxID=2911366 RepID=A0ABS9KAV8_9BACT|nr:hypothetical protein [Rhodohalobacter sulfatireducens]MCG2587987.1 hypothetical protein [Rhodohalobacter sulfatireducens]MDR9365983.1 hypothetical protein [Balneolaceae bacterium]MDR9408759.1 hypothetical protein [Balneolaceae bacterium]